MLVDQETPVTPRREINDGDVGVDTNDDKIKDQLIDDEFKSKA